MALQVHREPEHGLVRQPGGTLADQAAGGQHAGDDRRGRRAEAPAVRDRVDAAQPDPRRLTAEHAEHGAHGADDEMALPRPSRFPALAQPPYAPPPPPTPPPPLAVQP